MISWISRAIRHKGKGTQNVVKLLAMDSTGQDVAIVAGNVGMLTFAVADACDRCNCRASVEVFRLPIEADFLLREADAVKTADGFHMTSFRPCNLVVSAWRICVASSLARSV